MVRDRRFDRARLLPAENTRVPVVGRVSSSVWENPMVGEKPRSSQAVRGSVSVVRDDGGAQSSRASRATRTAYLWLKLPITNPSSATTFPVNNQTLTLSTTCNKLKENPKLQLQNSSEMKKIQKSNFKIRPKFWNDKTPPSKFGHNIEKNYSRCESKKVLQM